MKFLSNFPFFTKKSNQKKTEIMCQPTNCWGICNPPDQCQFQTSKTPLHSIPKGIDSMAIRNSSEEAVCKGSRYFQRLLRVERSLRLLQWQGPIFPPWQTAWPCLPRKSWDWKTSKMRKLRLMAFMTQFFGRWQLHICTFGGTMLEKCVHDH